MSSATTINEVVIKQDMELSYRCADLRNGVLACRPSEGLRSDSALLERGGVLKGVRGGVLKGVRGGVVATMRQVPGVRTSFDNGVAVDAKGAMGVTGDFGEVVPSVMAFPGRRGV